MRRFLTGLTAILTVVVLIVGCSSSDDTADEPTTATSATTVAPPETVTTAASTTSTTMSLTAAIATAEALHEAFNASDPGAALALFADGAFDGGLLPGSPVWEERFAGAGAAWGRRSTLSDCEATGNTLTCVETWERTNLSGKAGVIRVHEWSFRFDDQGLITNHEEESVSGYEDDRAFEAALGNWMAIAHPESYETFYNPESNGINEETWLSGIDELSPLIDEFIAQSDEYPLDSSSGPLTIMPIGDSITQPRESWCTYRWNLDGMLNDAGVTFDVVGSQSEPHPFGSYGCSTAFDMDHESYWGAKIDWVGNKAIPSVETLQPDVALVHLGSNNLGQSPAAAADELESFITGLQSVSPDITILVAQIIPCDPGPVPEYGVECAENLPAFNDLIASFTSLSTGESAVIVVDMETNFSLSDLRDKSHPNDAGDETIAHRWMKAMEDAGLI